jgi:hypothetical protein
VALSVGVHGRIGFFQHLRGVIARNIRALAQNGVLTNVGAISSGPIGLSGHAMSKVNS